MEYLIAAYTDIGIRKETNQDSICVRRAAVAGVGETVLAVVCDGMGGLKKGELASASAVTAFGNWFDTYLSRLPALCGSDFSMIRRQWLALIEELHHDLLRYTVETCAQLGTTVAAFFAYGDRYLIMNVGDSRVYERKNCLLQLTHDQSLVAREIAAGRITEEESRHHPQRNILLQCLGAGEQISPEFIEGRVQSGALYLLCSDGLVHELSPAELADRFQAVYLSSKESMTSALHAAAEVCKVRGETDNITAVLLKAQESVYTRPKRLGTNHFKRILNIASSDNQDTIPVLKETAQVIHTQEVIGRR